MLPYKTSTSDYAVEAEIRAGTGQYGNSEFGLRVRVNGSAAGYIGSVEGGSAAIKSFDSGYAITNVPFSSGTGWHIYRFECRGNSLRLLVDGMLVADGTDTRYPSGGQVGLYDNYMPLTVRAIRVIALHDQP